MRLSNRLYFSCLYLAETDIDPDFDRETRIPSRPYTDNVAVSDRAGRVVLELVSQKDQTFEVGDTELVFGALGIDFAESVDAVEEADGECACV